MTNGEALDLAALADSDEVAASRYVKHRSLDPFPDVEAALLNTADLFDYIVETGMIHPFEVDPDHLDERLKPAACAIPIGGPYLYWEADPGSEVAQNGREPQTGTLEPGGDLFLRPNSIVYVTLEPTFRLPDYIAGRFNLTIRDIYRGLLVGTGPLVDPGFVGRLSLPLHNLTANDYRLVGGEPIVWMEFTKLSHNRRWNPKLGRANPKYGGFVEFPERKREHDVGWYVRRASEGRPIVSSIPQLFVKTERAAQQARTDADNARGEAAKIRQRFTTLSLWGAAAFFVALGAVLVSVWALVWSVRGDLSERDDRIVDLGRAVDQQRAQLEDQREDIRVLREEVSRLERARGR